MKPSATAATLRQQIAQLLERQAMTLRDLSQALGVTEKEVVGHLEHIARSVKTQGRRLQVDPYRCLSCGFAFDTRRRFSRPSRCPQCRKTHLSPAAYRIL